MILLSLNAFDSESSSPTEGMEIPLFLRQVAPEEKGFLFSHIVEGNYK